MTAQNHKNKNICQRANRYGTNYRDFVRGYLVNAPPPIPQNLQLLEQLRQMKCQSQ